MRKGPRIALARCNICSWLRKRKVIKVRGHKCSEAAKKAVGAMNRMQLSRAVVNIKASSVALNRSWH